MDINLNFIEQKVDKNFFIEKKYHVLVGKSRKVRAVITGRKNDKKTHFIDYGGIGYEVATFEDAKSHAQKWFESLLKTMGF